MPILEVNGTRVEVDDSFLTLPADQQATEIDAIAAQITKTRRDALTPERVQGQVTRGEKASQIPEGVDLSSVSARLDDTFENDQISAMQGIAPIARDRLPAVGRIVETDAGTMIDDGTGFENLVFFDTSKNFAGRDTKTGELMAFNRDPEFEEGRLESLARIMLPGIVGNAPTRIANALTSGDRVARATRAAKAAQPTAGQAITKTAQEAVGQADEFAIPLTRGQATGDFAQIAKERQLLRADAGPGNTMRGFAQAQDDAIRAAAEGIGTDLAQGRSFGAQVEDAAGTLIQEGVQQTARSLKEPAQRLYSEVSKSGASVRVEAVSDLRNSIQKTLETGGIRVDARLHPTAATMLERISELSQLRGSAQPIVPSAAGLTAPGSRVAAVSFEAIETLNKELNQLRGINANDARAVREVKRAFSTWLEGLGDSAFLAGDATIIKQFKEANSLWREYRKITSPKTGDTAGKFLSKVEANNVSIQEVSRAIVGMAESGVTERSVQIAKRVGEIVGKDSEAWAALRQATWFKLTQNADGLTQKGTQKIAQNVAQFTNGKGRGLAQVLFSKQERTLMNRFANTLRRTIPPAGAENPPNSAFIAAKLLGPIGDKLIAALTATTMGLDVGFGALVSLPLFRFAKETRAARTATTRPVPKARSRPQVSGLSNENVKLLLFGGQAATQAVTPP